MMGGHIRQRLAAGVAELIHTVRRDGKAAQRGMKVRAGRGRERTLTAAPLHRMEQSRGKNRKKKKIIKTLRVTSWRSFWSRRVSTKVPCQPH